MAEINEKSFPDIVTGPMQAEFWHRVKYGVQTVYGQDPGLVEAYRRQVRDAPVSEQMMVYREEPLEIAADLVDLASGSSVARDDEGIRLDDRQKYEDRFPDPIGLALTDGQGGGGPHEGLRAK